MYDFCWKKIPRMNKAELRKGDEKNLKRGQNDKLKFWAGIWQIKCICQPGCLGSATNGDAVVASQWRRWCEVQLGRLVRSL